MITHNGIGTNTNRKILSLEPPPFSSAQLSRNGGFEDYQIEWVP